MGRAGEAYRPSAFRRDMLTFRLQRWYLSPGTQLCVQLAPLLPQNESAAKQWLTEPFDGARPFPLWRKGCKARKPVPASNKSVQSRRPTPSCSECRRNVLLVIREVSQLALRLQVSGNRQYSWTLRATHNSDEVRYPSDKRRSTCASARRLVRGSPAVDASEDFWPGGKARGRPPASRADGEPQAEPSISPKLSAAAKKSLSQHGESGGPRDEFRPPPACVAWRAAGKCLQVLKFPLCYLSLTREEVNVLYDTPGPADRRGAGFQMGRAPFGSKYCAAWRALFESFTPAQQVLVPVYRFFDPFPRGDVARRYGSGLLRRVYDGVSDSVVDSEFGGVARGIGKPGACVRAWATSRNPTRRFLVSAANSLVRPAVWGRLAAQRECRLRRLLAPPLVRV